MGSVALHRTAKQRDYYRVVTKPWDYYCFSSDVQDIFDTLADTGNTYDIAKTKLEAHFKPKQNVPYNRHVFRQAQQTADETVPQFVTRLKKLAIGCSYDTADDFIRDQVIEKCRSNLLRKKLLAEVDLKLEKALELARALEISESHAATMSMTASASNSETVHAVKNKPQYKKKFHSEKKRDQRNEGEAASRQSGQKCTRCGQSNHLAADCKCSRNITCYKCNRRGHFQSECRARQPQTSGGNRGRDQNYRQRNRSTPESVRHVQDYSPEFSNAPPEYREHTNSTHPEDDYLFSLNLKPMYSVSIANRPVEMIIDSGSSCNILNTAIACELQQQGVTLQKCHRVVHPYKSEPIIARQNLTTTVAAGSKSLEAEFLIISGNEPPLLGKTTAENLGILRVGPPVNNVNTVQTAESQTHVDQILSSLPGICDGIGKLKGHQVHLYVDSNVTPVAERRSRTPFHLRPQVEKEIEKLLKADIIEPVTGPTEWVSGIVTPPKPNDPTQIRLCVDMRNANKAIKRTRHVTPTIEELTSDLNGATVFSKIDLTAGYHQLELAPASRAITTFSTHMGLFRYKRLNFGVNAAAEHFQHTIQGVIAGIPGVKNVSDDIIVYGKTQQDHDAALHAVLAVLHQKGLTINRSKLDLNKKSIEYFGFMFSEAGLSPTPGKIIALKEAAPPKNPSEVRSFLGMAQYSSRFIRDFSTVSEPLRLLTHKHAKWVFGDAQTKSFNAIKNALTNVATNAYFDPNRQTDVLVDASPVGISAILIQEGRPVVYASRALTPVEQRYSQLEREALAVIWSCEHLNIYLQGSSFRCLTDHKPLLGIWQKANPPPRLARWALRLQPYSMSLEYRPGHDNPADYMSRHPCQSSTQHAQVSAEQSVAEQYVACIASFSAPYALTLDEIRNATKSDETLQHVIETCQTNRWHQPPPNNPNIDRGAFKSFKSLRNELTVNAEKDILLRDNRIVIPKSLENRVLSLAHEVHHGICKTKALLRSKVWFPGIDKAVETMIAGCIPCQSVNTGIKTAPLMMSPLPGSPWLSLSIDFCGPLPSGEYLLVLIDEYTRYPIVEIVPSTSAQVIIPRLEKIFALFSYPSVIKSDNGPPFNGTAWSDFLHSCGIKHRKITPYWPQANGQVESFNKPLMKAIRAAHTENRSWKREIHSFLRLYRTTPHSTTNVTPHRLMFGRDPITKLPQIVQSSSTDTDRIVKNNDRVSKEKAKLYADQKRNVRENTVQPGDRVLIRQPKTNKMSTPYNPVPLVVTRVKGTMITAKRSNNSTVTRNVSHFRRLPKTTVQEKPEHVQSEDDDIEISVQEPPPAIPPRAGPEHIRPPRHVQRPQRLIEEI